MSKENVDIHNSSYFLSNVTATNPADIALGASKGTESGLSSIEKSKHVVIDLIPLASLPNLQPPQSDNVFASVVSSIGSSDALGANNVQSFLSAQQLKLEQITNDLLDAWSKSIHEMEDQVRQLINSPMYQELQLIRIRGEHYQGNAAEIASLAASNVAVSNFNPFNVNNPFNNHLINAIDNLHVFERIPPAASVTDPADPKDYTKTLTIPLLAAVFAGVGLALGGVQATGLATVEAGVGGTHPLTGVVQLVENLQPILPQIAAANIVTLINVITTPLIYFASWNNAVGSLRNKENASNREAIQNFAKQVIQIVSNPDFIQTLTSKIQGADQLSSKQKDQISAAIKLILSSVALSLLYSFDVGKVIEDKFLGMEIQEFQGLLTGTIPVPDVAASKGATTQAQLVSTLLNVVKYQLTILPNGQKVAIIGLVFDYLASVRNLKSLLEPFKIFQDLLHNSHFDSKGAKLESNPA